ncbi:MAG TPA: hypothetical protein VKW06_09125 [Candidatus Angelobacter sp.]|nr:hypothetical protein [Candidatus Angelobacter sp.]
MLRHLSLCALALLFASACCAQAPQTLSVPVDSPRWDLEGNAKPSEFLGRKCLMLDGGGAGLKDFEMRDAVIDVDAATSARRGFFGIQFRIAGNNAEEVYLRQHKSGLPDAMQYTPILNLGRNWQIYNGPGFTGAIEIPKDVWFHMRLEVTGAQARLYVQDMNKDKPALVINDLKSGVQKGEVPLFDLTGATCFSNFEIRTTSEAPWERRLPAMPKDTLVKWSLSPAFDALARNLERPLLASERDAIQWQDVEAEPPGFVVINRYRDEPQIRVSFQGDFSKRLEPQPGMKVVYARTSIESDREQVKRLDIGYSDEVSVFLNGKILYRGRSAQGFRDPGFLGIVNPENDAVYLPLKKGSNELILAVSELGGGWGFICRLAEMEAH